MTPPAADRSVSTGDGEARTGDRGTRSGDRAVSDVVGFVLVFALVVSVVAVVSLAGLGSLESARDAGQTNNAERAMGILADNAADVYQRGAPSRATEISLDDAQMYLDEPVTVRVADAEGSVSFDESFSIRPLVYRGPDGTELVYSMGALFRVQDRGGVVVGEWPGRVTGDRVAMPVVNTSSATGGAQSIASSTVLVRTVARDRSIVAEATDFEEEWTIRIDSPRRELWFRTLDRRAGVDCDLPTGDDHVLCTMTGEPSALYLTETRIEVSIDR